jgi:hypothetical protein
VNYTGSDYIVVGVKDEFSSVVPTQYYYVPSPANVVAKNILPNHYSWVYISTRNDYGSAQMDVEIKPVNMPYMIRADHSEPMSYTLDDSEPRGAEAVDISGNVVASGGIDEVKSRLAPGFYVINLVSGGRVIGQRKYLKR